MPDTANTPLLSEYKLAYVLRTLLQTFLGGLQLYLPFKTPCYVYLMQLLIWILPALIGVLASLIMGSLHAKDYYVAVICGFLFTLLNCLIYAAIFFGKTQPREDSPVHNFLAEEDEINFTNLCSSNTLEFIVPLKDMYFNYLLHSTLSGSLIFLGLMILQVNHLLLLFPSNVGVYFIIILGWFVICVSNYSLIGKVPKEISMFYFNNNLNGLSAMTRSVYVMILLTSVLVIRDCYDGIQKYYDSLLLLHIIFFLTPILWLLGILPRLDGFVVWILEQVYMILFGGNQMASMRRLLVSMTVSVVFAAITYIIPSCIISIVVSTCSSVILSLDVNYIISCIYKKIYRVKFRKNPVTKMAATSPISHHVVISHTLLVVLLTVSTGVITALTIRYDLQEKKPFYILTISLLILTVFIKILTSLQRTYWFSLLRNPLLSFFEKVDWIRKTCFSFTVIVIPLVLVVMSSIVANHNASDCDTLIYTVLMFRLHRMIWLDPIRCSYDFILFALLDWLDIVTWKDIPSYTQLFIISITSKVLHSIVNKTIFAISLIVFSFKQPRYQRRKVLTSFILSLLLLPFTVMVFILSSVLSLPVLPLFTLPIFFIAPPKLSCLWPNTCLSYHSSQCDWVFYDHLQPSLIESLKNYFHVLNGIQAGQFYLIRFQDRLIFINILERGLLHSNIVIKGLELQETSCHAVEAQMIDDVIDYTVNNNKLLNENLLSVLTPQTNISFEAYSDAKNVLTGIIDNKDFTFLISKIFMKCLIRNFVKFCHERPNASFKEMFLSGDDDSPLNTQITNLTPEDLDSSIMVTTSFGTRTINSGLQKKILTHLPNNNRSESTDSPNSNEMLNPNLLKRDDDVNGNNADDEFGNFGFDDSSSFSSEISLHYSDNEAEENRGKEALISLSLSYNEHIKPFILPLRWTKRIPFNERQLCDVMKDFPIDWFQYVLQSYSDHHNEIVKEESLLRQYKSLVSTCYNLLEVLPVNNDVSLKAKSVLICQNFHGILPWSPQLSFLEDDPKLKELVLSAYRIAFKLTYDSIVLGIDMDNMEELLVAMQQCEEHWIIGPENNEAWTTGILQGLPNLLSMDHDKRKNVFKSRLLTKQTIDVPIFKLERECVLALWSALSFELFYMTNDDDERYSIQALPGIFRNILIQCADPPLGYPIYSSGLQTLNLWN